VAALRPGALVFEQITPALAAKITPDLIADPEKLKAVLEWEERGWPDFDMYYPIFVAAPDAAYFGGGAPIADVHRAISEGAAAVFGDGAERFSLDRVFSDEVQAKLEAIQRDAHCGALPEDMLPGMVEAQRFRDAYLARAAIAAHFEAVSDGWAPVVVITGNGHAVNDLGVPSMLRVQDMGLAVLSVGQFEQLAPDDVPDFDYWLLTEGAERDDPCAAFRK
jgi:hypothetical protein